MIVEIPQMSFPSWLKDITADAIHRNPFPLQDILQDSLYYPGAGTDGKPVNWFAGNTYSFVYVDYMVSRTSLFSEIESETNGFIGYRILATRDVTKNELTPNGWSPIRPNYHDGNPMQWSQHFATPFCVWAIFERLPDFQPEHGPERFSLLYLCGDGVAGFQALYNSNCLRPRILFLIQHGYGCNWTDFEDQERILARSVVDNNAGMPDWLVGRCKNDEYSGDKDSSPWPRYYSGSFTRYLDGGHGYALWPLT